MDGPYFVVIDEFAFIVNRAVGEAVCARVQHAIRLQEAAVIDLLAAGVLYREFDPCLIEIAYFGNQRVADVLVLDHDIGLDRIVRSEAEYGDLAQRSDQLRRRPALPERKDIHVEIVAGAQKLDCLLQLLIEAVIERNGCVAGQPSMRGKGTVLCAVVGQRDWQLRFM